MKQSKFALTAVASFVSTFAHAADVADAVAIEALNFSSAALATINTLRIAHGSNTSAYLGDVTAIFGTKGIHHSKPEYDAGSLRTQLEKALPGDADERAAMMDRIKFKLGTVRAVAFYVADPAHAATAQADGATLTALYKACMDARPASEVTTRAAKTPTAKVEASGDTSASAASSMTVAEAVKLFGAKAILAECARVLSERKATSLQGKTVAAVAEQVAA